MTRKTDSSLALDQHVGQKIRWFRIQKGLSQNDLAHLIGVSYQQLHKYENGSNSVSASRMFELAEALGVSVSMFFEDFSDEEEAPSAEAAALGREQLVLMKYFNQIKDPKTRESILSFVQSLSDLGV